MDGALCERSQFFKILIEWCSTPVFVSQASIFVEDEYWKFVGSIFAPTEFVQHHLRGPNLGCWFTGPFQQARLSGFYILGARLSAVV